MVDIIKTGFSRSVQPKFVELFTILFMIIAMAETEDALLRDMIGASA